MAQAFRRANPTTISGYLEAEERQLLDSVFDTVAILLASEQPAANQDPLAAMVGISSSANLSSDPALQRLFPNAYRTDPEAANDFRRYTEESLREQKLDNANQAITLLEDQPDDLQMSIKQAQIISAALNDARLILGSRLELTDEHSLDTLLEVEVNNEGPAHLYEWLTWLQESLVRSLMD